MHFAIQPKTKVLLKHTTLNSTDYKKDRVVKQMLSDSLADFDSTDINHNLGRFMGNKIVDD
jgi:hypothetical protein